MKCENFPPLWTWQKQNKDKLQVIFYYSGEETKPSMIYPYAFEW